MLLRLLLLGLLIGAILRFLARVFSFFLIKRPVVDTTRTKKRERPRDLDDSQIQDADYKDL